MHLCTSANVHGAKRHKCIRELTHLSRGHALSSLVPGIIPFKALSVFFGIFFILAEKRIMNFYNAVINYYYLLNKKAL